MDSTSSDTELEFDGTHENSASDDVKQKSEFPKYYTNYSGSALEELLQVEKQEQFRKTIKRVAFPLDKIKAFIYGITAEYKTPVVR
jgi:hypothetical protein